MRKVDSRENEDHEDFILMSDDYLRTTQAVDEKYKVPEDERVRTVQEDSVGLEQRRIVKTLQ